MRTYVKKPLADGITPDDQLCRYLTLSVEETEFMVEPGVPRLP